MSRRVVMLALIMMDAAITAAASYLALCIRFDWNVDETYFAITSNYLIFIMSIRVALLYKFGLYNRLWRYASIQELLSIVSATTLSSVVIIAFIQISVPGYSKGVHILAWLLNIVLIGLSRFFIRIVYFVRALPYKGDCQNVLIIGAGDAGAMLAREIQNSHSMKKRKIVGFVDDDEQKQHQQLFGTTVLGTCKDILRIVKIWGVDEIVIAMPSVKGQKLRDIVKECKKTACTVKTFPGICELIDEKITGQHLRNIDLDKLLRRDSVKLDLEKIAGYLSKKRVLVTGAGGSIGSELCRQIAMISPQQLVLLGKGENSIFDIDRDLRAEYPDIDIVPIIADIRNKQRIERIFLEYKPEVVFHAAAHKHVPLMEAQPVEAVQNNIFGTQNVAEAADRVGTTTFVMISTDKAVNPTSVMGATKRVAENIVQHMNKISKTKFVVVRFGNVLGSRGSVIPIFKKQIAEGGPITITHPDMQRYFMTIPEASQLVLQAGAMAHGNEIFVLDMGQPVKIVDMAQVLIELSGLVPNKDIKIEFIGKRPGEKMFEELLTAEEETKATKHEKIFIANSRPIDNERLYTTMEVLRRTDDDDTIIKCLMGLIPTYQSERVRAATINKTGFAKNHSAIPFGA